MKVGIHIKIGTLFLFQLFHSFLTALSRKRKKKKKKKKITETEEDSLLFYLSTLEYIYGTILKVLN